MERSVNKEAIFQSGLKKYGRNFVLLYVSWCCYFIFSLTCNYAWQFLKMLKKVSHSGNHKDKWMKENSQTGRIVILYWGRTGQSDSLSLCGVKSCLSSIHQGSRQCCEVHAPFRKEIGALIGLSNEQNYIIIMHK